MFFLYFELDDGKWVLSYQGRILEIIADGLCVVERYSLRLAKESHTTVMSLAQFQSAKLFQSEDAMLEAASAEAAKGI
jgi:hypothetical protein